MDRSFGNILLELRRGRDLSQRKLASALHVSQALLSHYENGSREPGLGFVCRACDYFGVSADFLLGRTDSTEGCVPSPIPAQAQLESLLARRDEALREPALGYLNAAAKRLIFRIENFHEPLSAEEQAAEMHQMELALLRLLSKNTGEGQEP